MLGAGFGECLFGSVGAWSWIDKLCRFFKFQTHVTQSLAKLFLYSVAAYSRTVVGWRTVPFLLGERNCLFDLVQFGYVLLGTRVLLDCSVLDFCPFAAVGDDVAIGVGQSYVVLVGRGKILLIFVPRHLYEQAHRFALSRLLDISSNIVYVVCTCTHQIYRPISFTKSIFGPAHLSAYIVLPDIGVFAFFAIGWRSFAVAKRSLSSG